MKHVKQAVSMSALAGLLMSVPAFAESGRAAPNMPIQEGTGNLDMTGTNDPTPSQYAVLPVPRGQQKGVSKHGLLGDEVKGKDGEPIGRLDRLIMDTRTGKIEYGVVTFSETKEMWPISWNNFKVNKESGEVSLNLTREQFRSKTSMDDAKDLSPDIKNLVKDIRKNMGGAAAPQEDSNRGKPGISSGGQVIPPDEGEQTGKPGTIFGGSATLPPGGAPGYEGADKGHKDQTR